MKQKKWRGDNQGSALVVLLIVTVFITIIATILIFVTGRSYKARQMDYQSKQNFYESEKVLDELKAALVKDCSSSCAKAYQSVLNEYLNMSAAQRKQTYQKEFVDEMQQIWNKRYGGEVTLLDAVKGVLSEEAKDCIESVGDIEGNPIDGCFVLKEVVVSNSTIDGYYTRIKTDIRVDAPSLEWNQSEAADEERIVYMPDYVVYTNWKRD